MPSQKALSTKTEPEIFVVGEWVDLRRRIAVDRWEGESARVTRVNGLEVYVNIGGDPRSPMAFFPRRSDGKHVQMRSHNGPVPDYEFSPTWIYHGRISEAFARDKAKSVPEKKAPLRGILDSVKSMFSNS